MYGEIMSKSEDMIKAIEEIDESLFIKTIASGLSDDQLASMAASQSNDVTDEESNAISESANRVTHRVKAAGRLLKNKAKSKTLHKKVKSHVKSAAKRAAVSGTKQLVKMFL